MCNWFKKSKPREKYALLVGINKYLPSLNCDLRGCVNDIEHMYDILVNMFNFPPDNIRVLTDERATRSNIVEHLWWLVKHTFSELVFQDSSHGSQVRDRNGDELNDGLDEILCPYDMDFDNPLTDDLLNRIFSKLPSSSFLTCIIDACHSGTMTREIIGEKPRFLTPPTDIAFRGINRDLPVKKIGQKSLLNHVLISACRDDQAAADAFIEGKWQGAMTYSLTKYISPEVSWADIFPNVVSLLDDNGFDQAQQMNGKSVASRDIFGGV